ncbi:M23 family peptidase [Alsobacter soli]|uniref:M23 family peptidase n=1 Tax=Alsobacter soli TaxID=2109933 RepID=A0A2T1HSF4_9HYPH|nr:M23 family metallopeptidase [Alsobacter soli]PSC04591.1 M23 family peptidase [Alsobacter soli]
MRIGLFAAAMSAMASGQAQAELLKLHAPVGCRLGETCFVQNYVDDDPAPGAVKDYQCGAQTYDGHDGVDFRPPSLAGPDGPTPVLAAASGTVLRVRDGVEDVSVKARGREAVAGQECGNGVVIDHGAGWSTQYCHMLKGSLAVRPGDRVGAGQRLGSVGMSGLAEFPHLHLTVRQDGRPVDPFAYGAPAGNCGAGQPLWDEAARKGLAYRQDALLNAGFADGPVTTDGLNLGQVRTPTAGSAALVAYVRLIALREGDALDLRLMDPAGATIAERQEPSLARSQAERMLFIGRKRPEGGFAPGAWTARCRVLRNGQAVLDRTFSITL